MRVFRIRLGSPKHDFTNSQGVWPIPAIGSSPNSFSRPPRQVHYRPSVLSASFSAPPPSPVRLPSPSSSETSLLNWAIIADLAALSSLISLKASSKIEVGPASRYYCGRIRT